MICEIWPVDGHEAARGYARCVFPRTRTYVSASNPSDAIALRCRSCAKSCTLGQTIKYGSPHVLKPIVADRHDVIVADATTISPTYDQTVYWIAACKTVAPFMDTQAGTYICVHAGEFPV